MVMITKRIKIKNSVATAASEEFLVIDSPPLLESQPSLGRLTIKLC